MTRIGIIKLEDAWCDAESMIRKLQNFLEDPLGEPLFSQTDFDKFYSIIETLCSQLPPYNYSHLLYDKYRENFQEYSVTTVLPSLEGKHDEYMLRELVSRWIIYCYMMRLMSAIFDYVDQYFVKRKSLPTLANVGLVCFRDLVYKEVKGNAGDAVINLIGKERDGEQIDRALLRDVLNIFVEVGMGSMGLYEQDFEAQMLQDTRDYYSRKASKWIVNDSCSAYMLKAEECLERERNRVSHYLHASSEQKLLEIVQHELLVVHATQLLEGVSRCHALLRDDRLLKTEDLSRMYKLYHNIPTGLDIFSTIFKRFVTAEGTALVQQAEDATSSQDANRSHVQAEVLIRKIIELHDKYMAFVYSLKNWLFCMVLKDAFEIFCNNTVAGSSIAELLAMFCDNILKNGGSKKLSDEALEETLKKVVRLLSYINDKDLFAKFYQIKLACRLLFNQSVNEDHEKSMLTKLKHAHGSNYTIKMEEMVTDWMLAPENKTKFEEYLHNNMNVNLGIDLMVTVFKAGSWLSLKPFDLRLPPEMLRCVEAFDKFYTTSTKKRKLTWNHSWGICKISGHFDLQPIDLILSTYQAAILLLFNDSDRLSYSEIITKLNLTHDAADRLLHSLSCAKYKILTKEPNTSTVLATDNFKFNSKFTSRGSVKIPLPPGDERRRVIEHVDEDRRYNIEAAIVRIMKRQKAMGYTELVMECVNQLAHVFKPDTKAIKKRIEDLIHREYLVRDQMEQDMIKYLPN